jgi:hypothetical protein
MESNGAGKAGPIRLALGFSFLLLIGCTIFESKKVTNEVPIGSSGRNGIAYFLPTGKLHIIAIKSELRETNDLNPTIDTVAVTGYDSNYTSTITTSPVQPQVPSLKTNNASTLTVVTNQGAGVVITSTLQTTNSVENIPVANAPDKQVMKTIAEASSTVKTLGYKYPITVRPVYQVTVTEELEKDGDRMFLLDPNFTFNSADAFHVTVGANGFLTSITSTNSDKSADILVELAKAAAEGFKLSVGGLAPQDGALTYPDRVDVVFDPFDSDQRESATNALWNARLVLNLSSFSNPGSDPYAAWTNVNRVSKGIVYRPTLPYEIRIEGNREFRSKTVFLPNKAPLLLYNPQKAAFVTTIHQIGFSNGCLVDVSADKPSQGLALAKVPMQILQTLTSLPTNILQLKFDIKSATQKLQSLETNSAALTVADLESQLKLIEARQRLTNALLGSPTNDLNAQVAALEAQIKLLDVQQRLLEAQRSAQTNLH